MARRGDELDAEAAEVPADRAEHVDVGLAGVAAAGADLRAACSERPKSRRSFVVERRGEAHLLVPGSPSTRSSRRRAAMRWSPVCVIAPSGQASTQSAQKRQRPEVERDRLARGARDRLRRADRRRRRGSRRRTCAASTRERAAVAVGQRGRRARRDRPSSRSRAAGDAAACRGRTWRGRPAQRSKPQYDRLKLLLQSGKSEICLAAQRQRQPGPVVERRVDDLVAAEAARARRSARRGRPRRASPRPAPRRACRAPAPASVARSSPSGGAASCSREELARALDLQPAHAGAGEDVAARPDGHRHLREAVPAGRDDRSARRAPGRRRAPPGRPGRAPRPARRTRVPTSSKRARTEAASQSQAAACSTSRERRVAAARAARRARSGVEVVAAAAGPHQAAPEAVAAEQRGEVEEIAADPAAGRRRSAGTPRRRPARRGRRCGWPAARARARCARSHCARSGASAPGQRLEHRRVGGGVRRSVVSPATVSIWLQRRAMRAADERPLDAAVLVAERDLQVQHLLAGALEAEVPRLDDAGMHRARPRPRGSRRLRRGRTRPSAGRVAVGRAAPASATDGPRARGRAAPRPRARTGAPAGASRRQRRDSAPANGALRPTASVLSASKASTATSRVAPRLPARRTTRRGARRARAPPPSASHELGRRPLGHVGPRQARGVASRAKGVAALMASGKSWRRRPSRPRAARRA